MKRIIYTVVFSCSTLLLFAQGIDRSKPPKPGPAPVINIADPASFTLDNGLKVFVVTNTKLPQVSATLTIDREPIFEGAHAGYVQMAGEVMRRGTQSMDKATLDEAIDFLGGDISSSAVAVSGSSLKKNFPKLFSLMADVALRPAFDEVELEKVRKQALSGLAQDKEDPGTIVQNVSGMLVYGKDHPYGEVMTDATAKQVTVEDIRKYHNTYWKPNIAYLVFVGDITTAEARKLAEANFSQWKQGDVPRPTYKTVSQTTKTYIAVVDRPSSVQSVINISAPVQLKPGAPDAIPTSVMATILGGGFSSRLNQNLREKYGFTYGAGGGISSDKLVGRFVASANVRNEKTDSAIGQFLYEFSRIRNEAPSDSELTAIKNYMSGGFARSLENPATVANFALNIARYNLPKDYYRNYLTRLGSVDATTVNTMANRYVPTDHLIITIVGNAKEIAPGLEKYGEVKYFDRDGNPAEAPTVKKVTDGVTGEAILKKALMAYGTESAINEIKDLTMIGSMDFMGQSLSFEQKIVTPDGFSMGMKMGEMQIMSQSKKGTEYSSMMQGMSQPLDDESKADLDARAAIFEERYYLTNKGYKTEVKGIEKVNGKDAYHLEITNGAGTATQVFYDVVSGLKVQEVKEQEGGPMGKLTVTTNIVEYKEFNGIKLPVKLEINAGPIQQQINITDVKVNQGLKISDL